MTAEAADLSIESERARILTEARALVDRIAEYTQLISRWAQEGEDDAEQ